MKSIDPFIRHWVTPKLPKQHIFILPENRPKGIYNLFRVYFRKWLVHPIKRRIARYYLRFLQFLFDIKVIVITGSAGKTTTKEMVASILKQKGETIVSYANIDPVYNIPTTILTCKPSTKYLVLEMGVEFPGEMDFYLWLVKPDIGIITNIYPTHTEFFGDSGGVFREKSKLVKSLSKNDTAVLYYENKFLRKLEGKLRAEISWFGNGTDIMFSQGKFTKDFKTEFLLIFNQNPKEIIRIKLPILGRQFISNALAASTAGWALGFSKEEIKKGLETFKPQEHRMVVKKLQSGAIVLDDSYNNNPQAAKEAIRTLSWTSFPGKIIVFGDMLELGNWEEKYHRQLGRFIARFRPSRLICVGEASKITSDETAKILGSWRVSWVKDWKEALIVLKPLLKKGTITLIKGSRSVGLDNIPSRLS